MCLFYKNMLILGKCAYFGKWRISQFRYSLYRQKGVLIMGNVLIMGVFIMVNELIMGYVH